MRKAIILLLTLCFIFPSLTNGQVTGGQSSFEFLNLPASARVTGLGGSVITVVDDDATLAYQNPAMLTDSVSGAITFNQAGLFADARHGYVSFAKKTNLWGLTGNLGIQYINYGDFSRADEIGNQSGTFSANEYAITLGAGKKLNERIQAGINVKLILSNYESYSASALATDFALNYINRDSKFIAGFLVRNVGFSLSSFNDSDLSMPLDIQLGVSKKLAHLPLRVSVTAHQLQQWNVRHDDPDVNVETNLFGEEDEPTGAVASSIDNFFRHMIFGAELLIGKHQNLKLRAGYNHLRAQELAVSEFRSLSGLSLGFGFKIYKFNIDYGVGYHHVAGASNHITVRTSLSRFRKI